MPAHHRAGLGTPSIGRQQFAGHSIVSCHWSGCDAARWAIISVQVWCRMFILGWIWPPPPNNCSPCHLSMRSTQVARSCAALRHTAITRLHCTPVRLHMLAIVGRFSPRFQAGNHSADLGHRSSVLSNSTPCISALQPAPKRSSSGIAMPV